jgi:hypothetical protein
MLLLIYFSLTGAKRKVEWQAGAAAGGAFEQMELAEGLEPPTL